MLKQVNNVLTCLRAHILTCCSCRCPNALSLGDEKIPYCRSRRLDTVHEDVTHAVIVQHGNCRNADEYFDSVMDHGEDADVLDHTTILAPQFITEADSDEHDLGDEYTYWTSDAWKLGGDASDVGGLGTSSFEW